MSGNDSGMDGVEILEKEELCEKVVKVPRRNDRVMAMALMLEEEIVRVISAHGQQNGKTMVKSSDSTMK